MAAFTSGNIVIYRVGSGSGSLINTGNPVFLDEYTPTGTLVQSIALPTTASGANSPLIASGTATSEGLLTRSADGHFLLLTGYGTTTGGGSSLANTTSASVPRVIGRVDANGTIDTTTALTDGADGNNPRGAASRNGTDFWFTGGTGGVRYVAYDGDAATDTSLQLSTTVTNLRAVEIFNGQLYVSDSSGSAVRLGTVGSGTPTTSGQTITNLPGFPTSGSPYAFFFADLTATVAGVDTLYVASDDAAALTKYSLVGGTWVSNGTVGVDADDYRSLTATVGGDGDDVTLYATRKGGSGAAGGGELVKLTDTTGYNGAFSGTPTLLATAPNQEAFRGVALTPEAATDTTPPTLSSSNPADDASNVAVSSNIVLTFSENVQKGVGNILIKLSSDNSTVQTIDVTTAAVTVSNNIVTINHPTDLAAGTGYYIEIAAGVIKDLANNNYAGISGATTLNFTTASSESQVVTFDPASLTVSHSEGNSGTTDYVFTVQRTGGTTGDVSFSATFASSNTDAADYQGGVLLTTVSGQILAGQTTGTVTIHVAGDGTPESNESFTLTLDNVSNNNAGASAALAGSNLIAAGTITDDDSFTHIYTIQGSGHTSPLVGQAMTTRGVVTAVDTNGGAGSRGFYIQDPDGDGSSATSDGIFVFVP